MNTKETKSKQSLKTIKKIKYEPILGQLVL